MAPVEPRQALAPEDVANQLTNHVPEIEQIAHISYQMVFNLDSANMQSDHWQKLAAIIFENLSQYHGFVVIHGTDTMVYTASALSFMLQNLNRPVILTGSQRPLRMIRTDARTNLINSVELATHPIPEVSIFFGTKLLRGNRAVKISSTHYQAFDSPNYPPLAEVGLDVQIFDRHAKPKKEPILKEKFSDRVAAVRFFPDMNPDYFRWLLDSPVQAVVLEALGLGHVAILDKSLIPLVEELVTHQKLVVITSQSLHGRVDLHRYQNGELLARAGAVGAGDMTTEATIVKLMHLLAYFPDDIPQIKSLLVQNIAGEITAPKRS